MLTAGFFCLAARCVYLQLLESDYFSSESAKQRQKWVIQQPQRGVILDSKGRVLAASNEIQVIFAEPRAIKDLEGVSQKLSKILRIDADRIFQIIESSQNPGYAKIKAGASEAECKQASKIPGISIHSYWQRYYPMGPLASHVVGFTSDDNKGQEGVELKYDKDLTGDEGQNIVFADVLRRPVRLKEQTARLKDGCGVILTIDSAIQEFTRVELMKALTSFQAESASAVVIEPKTGKILALVSLPDYDPNKTIRPSDMPRVRNRTICDQYEPGSVIKPVVASIALQNKVLSTSEKIFCENGVYRGKGFGRIGEYGNHRYGSMTVRGILVESSNIGMAKIGQKLGAKKLYQGLTAFGFGSKTGVDLPGEAEGKLRPPGEWTGYSVTRIPFGQEISTTALQLLKGYCILANGGYKIEPYVVQAVVDSSGNIVKQHQQPVPEYIIHPDVANWIIREALVGVVNEGTGKQAKLKKWQVFGKTGTAQLPLKNQRGYSDEDYAASFIGGAPAEDPKVLVLVTVIKPNKRLGKGYTGGAAAAPAAGKIIEAVLNYLETSSM